MTDPVVANVVEIFVQMAELNAIDPGLFGACQPRNFEKFCRRGSTEDARENSGSASCRVKTSLPPGFLPPRWQPRGQLERATN